MDKNEFTSLMSAARKAYVKADKLMQALMNRINEETPDVELDKVETSAENADNFEQAVLCYLQYGEYSVDELWEELKPFLKENE